MFNIFSLCFQQYLTDVSLMNRDVNMPNLLQKKNGFWFSRTGKLSKWTAKDCLHCIFSRVNKWTLSQAVEDECVQREEKKERWKWVRKFGYVYVCVRVSVCVCVRACKCVRVCARGNRREGKREGERVYKSSRLLIAFIYSSPTWNKTWPRNNDSRRRVSLSIVNISGHC